MHRVSKLRNRAIPLGTHTLAGKAARALDKFRQGRELKASDVLSGLSLMDFVVALEPKYKRPLHFHPLVDSLEAALRGEAQREVVHGPPQHGKTSLLQAFVPYVLRARPDLVVGYAAYGDRLARSKSRKMRHLSRLAGVEIVTNSVNDWRTSAGGGLIATGAGGPLAGERVDIMLIDDPVKNRVEAESPADRERKAEWFEDVVNTRVHPGGSIFCFGTRWHQDDLGGHLIKHHKFHFMKFQAITKGDDGVERALAPHLFDVRDFDSKRRNEYTWASLYQGEPRAKGKTEFDPPSTYTKAPSVMRTAFGIDGAYSKKTAADYSAVVRLGMGRVDGDPMPHFFVLYAHRAQVRMPEFKVTLRKLHELDPSARWRWYTSTTELGVADLLGGKDGAPVHGVIARGDKRTRAIPLAEAWNNGRVHVPSHAPWLEDLVSEVLSFTGVNDPQDDFVDALAAAFDLLNATGDAIIKPLTRPVLTGLAGADM